MESNIQPEIRTSLCNGCGECVPACPHGALAVIGGRVVLAHPELCRYDGSCELACPKGAISVPYAIVFGPDAAES